MNNHIKSLIKQAGINLTPAQFSGVLEDEVSEFELEELAKLIIDDVVAIINNPVNYNESVYTTFDLAQGNAVAQQLIKKIKEHFKDAQ